MPESLKSRFESCDRRTMRQNEKDALKSDILAAAEAGSAQAMYLAGRLYYEGFTVDQDYTTARKWFERAADQGEDGGCLYLGYCYYYGRNIPVDYEKAFHAFSLAAENGDHCALYKLGDMYRDGRYVKQNGKKAIDYYRQALSHVTSDSPDYPNIVSRIGHCLFLGIGCPPDLLAAMHDLNTAKEKCYALLAKGDPYAHLPLPGIKADLSAIESQLDRQFAPEAQNVQYT
ncbi:MAG: sel1 repeat family protein [Eubacteriaceae bacterium]|uniref:Sel1 repeat family protein n=1 Tax=Candidatus Pseudoramibacter fermentans TaxID=2594427 RepID=A0A6L5GQZ4_9FIRM|nr:sel1 repeat family protein [Candidatus Pseudoramibacter fermentans]RRF93993.1 MAG: sel1 repeat family protein [Eubacteriaceae bacterium]